MKTILPIGLVILIAAASGWLHGNLTERWGVSADTKAVALRIEGLQVDVDGWETGEPHSIEDPVRNQAGAEGYTSRHYVDSETGASVQATVMCGPPGPIAMHIPAVCFTNAGMTQLAEQVPATLPGAEDEQQHFWMADYRPPESRPGPPIRTFWSWSPDAKSWQTPEDPRFEYARNPYLYRIYFTAPSEIFERRSEAADDSEEAEVKSKAELRFEAFVRDFLSQLSAAAQPEPTNSDSDTEPDSA